MKYFSPLFSLVAMLVLLPPAKGDDVITNIVSPIASYQYPEEINGQILTNGGIISPIISYQFPEDISDQALAGGGILSPITSYQYPEDINTQLLTSGGILAPIASYQYFEWPSNILNLQYSRTVSYFWQSGSSPALTYLHGWVTDGSGVALSGVTVSVDVFLTSSAQASTDANGYYQMPSLGAGVYNLWTTKAAYQTSIRAFTFGTSTAEQDFQLHPMPPTPATVQVSRAASVPYTVSDLMRSQLLIYNGASFVPITASNWPSASLMSIVMTHGWNSDPTVWAQDMAAKMTADGVNANILAWDWHAAATNPPWKVGISADRTPDQGVGLGEALQYYLGAGYTLPLHFLGHSLGTLVNASAIDFVHGDKPGISPQAAWNTNLMHVTLFDQAEVAEAIGLTLNQQNPLPLHFAWADSYTSLVGGLSGKRMGGFWSQRAVNVTLQKGMLVTVIDNPLGIVTDTHRYAVNWYNMSIITPSDANNPLGFKQSYEYAPASFPPTAYTPGSTYHQSPWNYDVLALEPILIQPPFRLYGDIVVQTTVDTVQYSGGVFVNAADSTWNVATGLFNYVWNVAAQGGQCVVSAFNSANSLGVSLTTGPYTAIQHLNQGLVRPMESPSPADSGSTASNTPAMVWLPIQFPAHAVAMTFDFELSSDPVNDVLVCGIDTNNLFSIQAKYIPTNHFSESRLIDISAWAGTTNELFFGLLGGSSTNATLQIQNIRFYSLQQPQLDIVPVNGTTLLTWPTTAAGYVVESTPSLISPVWETATNVPTISGDSYLLTNYWSDQTRFFRLRQN